MREYWTRYSDAQLPFELDQSARNAMFLRSKENEKSLFLQGVRSAGPLWSDALDIMSDLFRRYWETGVAGGNSEDLEQLGPGQKGVLNPMFAISSAPSGEFAVHYGTEPLLSFHLAPAFQGTISGQSLSAGAKIDRLVQAAKKQFQDWCSTFQDLVKNNQVYLQIICCDAIALCFEYQLEITLDARSRELARAYIKPWSSCPLVLDGQLPTTSSGKPAIRQFDVIDTSNLGDHVGLINMVTSCTPLLRPTHMASLCTESLLAASENPTTSLSSALGSDVATFSLVTGLIPTGFLNPVTMDGVCNEAILQSLSNAKESAAQKQYRLRIHWKLPLSGDNHARSSVEDGEGLRQRVNFEPEDLATYLFGIYRKMFADEDITSMFARAQRIKSSVFSTDMQRYTRAAAVALLRLVKTRSVTDWEELMPRFLNKIEGDQSLVVGSNSLQELYMHLTVLGVWTNPALTEGPRQLQDKLGLSLRSRSCDKGILGEVNVPPIVQIVLVVPRARLKPFTNRSPDLVGTPGIHVSVKQHIGQVQYENHFYSFHCCFGKFEFDHAHGTASTFEEDEKGWLGTADLIIICPVPAFGLLTGPRKGLTVALVLNSNPENMARFTQILGMMMVVFETNFDDRQRAFVCKDAPKLDSTHSYSMQKQWMEACVKKNQQHLEPLAKMHMGEKVISLQVRVGFTEGSEESRALASGVAVTITTTSLHTLLVRIGNQLTRHLNFPFPVKGSQSKTRIARKSSWIEVECPLHAVPDIDEFDSWTQIISDAEHNLSLCGMTRINLDIQPLVNVSTKSKISPWLSNFLGGALTHAEKDLPLDPGCSPNPLYDLKQSLGNIFLQFAGMNPQVSKPIRTFQLANENGCHTTIFANGMRHDLDLGSVVLDAFVIPFTVPRVMELRSALGRLQDTQPVTVEVSDKELVLWKRMLPGLAERCRTWNHKSTCEYRSKSIPLSTEEAQNPLCRCGEGKVPANFAKTVKEWAPFAKYAVRIALAPVFPMPYIEESVANMKMLESSAPSLAPSLGAKCDECSRASARLKSCAKCGRARYCSRDCQKKAWKAHKKECRK
ncbi:MAG: hypothetical protein Q9214_004536 [Letrouitia sp. 1 TL-2023]